MLGVQAVGMFRGFRVGAGCSGYLGVQDVQGSWVFRVFRVLGFQVIATHQCDLYQPA